MKLIAPIMLSLLFVFSTGAKTVTALDVNVGNGGDGIYDQGQLELLDFIEHEVEFPLLEKVEPVKEVVEILARAKLPVEVPAALLTHKLSELYSKGLKITSLSLARTLEYYKFKFVKYDLKNTKDENTPVAGTLYQLAIRLGGKIFINRRLWNELDPVSQVGLIMHELIFALIQPEETNAGFIQRSERVREINAFLFQTDWDKSSESELAQVLNELPYTDKKDLTLHHSGTLLYGKGSLLMAFDVNKKGRWNTGGSVLVSADTADIKAKCRTAIKDAGSGKWTLDDYTLYYKGGIQFSFSSYMSGRQRYNYVKWTRQGYNRSQSKKVNLGYVNSKNCVSRLRRVINESTGFGFQKKKETFSRTKTLKELLEEAEKARKSIGEVSFPRNGSFVIEVENWPKEVSTEELESEIDRLKRRVKDLED